MTGAKRNRLRTTRVRCPRCGVEAWLVVGGVITVAQWLDSHDVPWAIQRCKPKEALTPKKDGLRSLFMPDALPCGRCEKILSH